MMKLLARSWTSWASAALVAAGLGAAFLAGTVQGRTDAAPRAVTPRGPLAADELAHIELFKKTTASVVHITSLGVQRDMFSSNLQQVPRGTGTGFVWRSGVGGIG